MSSLRTSHCLLQVGSPWFVFSQILESIRRLGWAYNDLNKGDGSGAHNPYSCVRDMPLGVRAFGSSLAFQGLGAIRAINS